MRKILQYTYSSGETVVFPNYLISPKGNIWRHKHHEDKADVYVFKNFAHRIVYVCLSIDITQHHLLPFDR